MLAGGGAKGAYAFGCLKAFREKGIQFDAVSGTSVGALNAVIYATGSFDLGQDLWRKLSFSTIYPVALVDPKRFPRAVIWAVAAAFVLSQIAIAPLRRLPGPGRLLWSAFWAVLLCALPTAALLAGVSSRINFPWWLSMLVVFYSTATATAGFANGSSSAFTKMVGISFLPATFAGLFLAGSFSLPFFALHFPRVNTGIILAGLLIAYFGFVYQLFTLLERFVNYCQAPGDMTVLGRAPLRERLFEILSRNSLKIPCFATLGRHKFVFDPDAGSWFNHETDSETLGPPPQWYPNLRPEWLPSYHLVNEAPVQTKVDICLASAALPFGIVPHISIEGVDYVDGGVVDNVPFFPFCNTLPADEIFVVILRNAKDDGEALKAVGQSTERWQHLQRLMELGAFPVPKAESEVKDSDYAPPFSVPNEPPVVLPYRKPATLPKVHVFYPKSSLGGFLTGTLNFNGSYAERLIQQGYEDTLLKLKTLP